MDSIIGFFLECLALGREGKDGSRTARGCLFAIVAASALVMLMVVLVVWWITRP